MDLVKCPSRLRANDENYSEIKLNLEIFKKYFTVNNCITINRYVTGVPPTFEYPKIQCSGLRVGLYNDDGPNHVVGDRPFSDAIAGETTLSILIEGIILGYPSLM